MADAVKITVIATGFQPENAPIPERKAAAVPALASPPQPQPVAAEEPEQVSEPQPEPEPVIARERDDSAFDPEDLEVPAYLRQRRLLN